MRIARLGVNPDWPVRSVRNQDDFQKYQSETRMISQKPKCYKKPYKNHDDSKNAIKTNGKSQQPPKYKEKYNFRLGDEPLWLINHL